MLYVKNSALVKGLNAVKARLQGLGTSILKVGGFLSGLGASIVGPLSAALAHFTSTGDALGKMAARTGMSASSLAELGFAAEQGGGSIDDVEKSVRRMQRTIVDADEGMQSAVQVLDRLGLSAQQLKGLTPEQQFELIADRMAAIEDPTVRAATAMEVFGRSGTMLLPMLGNLREVREEARRRGLVPSEQAVKDAEEINDAFNRIRRTALAAVFEIGAALAPVLMPALEMIAQVVSATIRWVKENGALVRTVAAVGAGLVATGAIVTGIGVAIFGLGTAFGLAASALTAIAGAVGFLLSPLGLLIAAVVGGVAAWARFTASGQAAVRGIRAGLSELLAVGQAVIGGIGDALLAGDLALAGQIAIKGLQVVFLQGVAALADMLGGTLGDAVGTIGTKVLQGDLAGAWQTVVKGMATLWADFAEGVVAVFTQAARAVTDIWQKTVGGISDFILDQSAKGGVFGKIASTVLGVDLAAEQERTNKLNAQLGLTTTDITAQAKEDARAQVAATADAAREFLDGLDQSFREQSDAAREDFGTSIGGGGGKARDEASRLAGELEELRKQAAQAREAAAARTAAGAAPELDGLGGPEALKASATGTFSAAGAAALGFGGGGPTARIAKAAEKTVEKLDVLHKDMVSLRDKMLVPVAG